MFSVYGQVGFKCVREGEGFSVASFNKTNKNALPSTHINGSLVVNRLSQKGTSRARSFLIRKSIWTYGIQLWDKASTSNIEILERFQLKA
jgi:hypothetical protein